MCTNPIKIRNNKKLFRPGIDKEFLYVPCGHCYQCVQSRCNDWFVRLEKEFSDNKKAGLPVYFVTVTFNDKFCPHFSDYLQVGDVDDIDLFTPCFDKQMFSRFVSELRKYVGDGLRFFVVCEYGTDESKTFRPHYHILFFLGHYIDSAQFLAYCNFCWSKRVKKQFVPANIANTLMSSQSTERLNRGYKFVQFNEYYRTLDGCVNRFFVQRGFCSYSRKGAELLSVNGLSYVLKYLHKDFVQLTPWNKTIIRLQQWVAKHLHSTDKEIVKLRKVIRGCIPWSNQSKGLGSSYLHELGKMTVQQFSDFKRQGVQINNKCYPVPSYLLRRLLYESVIFDSKSTIYVLNKFGREVMISSYEDTINKYGKYYDMSLSYNYLKLYDGLLSELEKQYKVSDIIDDYRKIKSQYGADALATYEVVLRGVNTSLFSSDWIDKNPREVLSICRKFYEFNLNNLYADVSQPDFILDFHTQVVGGLTAYKNNLFSVIRFDELDCFQRFERVLGFVALVGTLTSQLIAELDTEKILRVYKARQFFNSF